MMDIHSIQTVTRRDCGGDPLTFPNTSTRLTFISLVKRLNISPL